MITEMVGESLWWECGPGGGVSIKQRIKELKELRELKERLHFTAVLYKLSNTFGRLKERGKQHIWKT